ncbi:general transcription factor II-I repeat domain-containing protein 2A-like [Octopus sinensis]|uniref:General transcription factor II-I repeat domain-containing protein 2A-like n=1 Tax=Octopus sinensis TaxID=2607531 RepID=A0A6P7S9U4_9MOLL|nr:general transcription factor II-I repeat domain-containing protein 2A-like [Octopus sinensis]
MASARKIRKVDKENHRFNEAWTNLYFFVESNAKCLCLICGETVAVPKVENVKRHYTLKHTLKHNRYEGDQRKEKVLLLQRNLVSQQNIFRKIDDGLKKYAKVSFVIAEKIAHNMKPFSEGDFIKECITSAIEILCPEKEKAIKCVSLLRNTITRRIEELAENTKMQLNELCKNFETYSIAINESTDMTDTLQLAIFINAKFSGILYFTEIRWLSHGRTLKCFYDIQEYVAAFLEAKGNLCINFDDDKWMNDFSFLVDITHKLNELNVQLQGKEKLIHNLFGEVTAFQKKMDLWITQIADSNYAHFPCLQEQPHISAINWEFFVSELKQMQEEFARRFKDFCACEDQLKTFSMSFDVDPVELQMELNELQSYFDVKSQILNRNLMDFYKYGLPHTQYPYLTCYSK